METLISNIAQEVSIASLSGKDYKVAKITLIAPGVLNGSLGPLYYPPEEIAKNPEAWNSIPIVVYHPVDNGSPISARQPDVINNRGIGYLFNARIEDQKLVADGYFDIKETARIDNRILVSLDTKKPIEVSTGLYTENEPIEGVTANGESYQYIARNYRPDHLAILPDQKGACSISDGCGVLVNSTEEKPPLVEDNLVTANKEEISMAKEKLVEALVANCSCLKGEEETLNAFSEEKLIELNETYAQNSKDSELAKLARNGFEDAEGNLHAYNEETSQWETVKKEPIQNEEAPTSEPQTLDEWMATAPAEVKEVVQNAQELKQKQHDELVNRIVANTNEDRRDFYASLTSNVLEELLQDFQITNNEEKEKKSFFGGAAGPAPVDNSAKKIKALPLPSLDFSK